MILRQMVVDAVVLEGRSLRDVARTYGVSKSWVAELVTRYREGGEAALAARSRAHHGDPRAMSPETEERVVRLRKELTDLGTGAGAQSIQVHLLSRYGEAPSVSAIYRALQRRGFITPEPRKRPKASYVRFEAELPNECWQTDMTHWQLADATEVQIITFLDDYSRRVMACEVRVSAKGSDVRDIFQRACRDWGTPASVLSDNGAIYNARQRGGRSGFESDLLSAGVLYKHSAPPDLRQGRALAPDVEGTARQTSRRLARGDATRARRGRRLLHPRAPAPITRPDDAERRLRITRQSPGPHPHQSTAPSTAQGRR